MSTNKDGGPAFPDDDSTPTNIHAFPVMQVLVEDGKVQFMQRATGMSLRDWFAGQALAGYGAHPANETLSGAVQNVATYCYGIADAMLKAREQ